MWSAPRDDVRGCKRRGRVTEARPQIRPLAVLRPVQSAQLRRTVLLVQRAVGRLQRSASLSRLNGIYMDELMAFTTCLASNIAHGLRKNPRPETFERTARAVRPQPAVGCRRSPLACNLVAAPPNPPYVGGGHAGGFPTLFLRLADHSAFLALGGEEGRVVRGSK